MPNDRCQPIRDDVANCRKTISELEDFVPEAPPSLKRTILERIKREKAHLTQLTRALRICERSH